MYTTNYEARVGNIYIYIFWMLYDGLFLLLFVNACANSASFNNKNLFFDRVFNTLKEFTINKHQQQRY